MRTRLHLVLLALAGALALALLACGGADDDRGADTEDPRALLERAFSKSPDGGEVKADIRVGVDGVEALDGPISLTLKGAFESRGEGKLSDADWDLTARAAGLALSGGLKIVDGTVYLEFQGDAYELGDPLAELDGDADKGDESKLSSIKLDPLAWVKDLEVEDGQDIGGDSTRKVTGTVDAEQAARDLLSLLGSPEVEREIGPRAELLPVPRLSDEDFDKLRDAIEQLSFEANVDDDDLLRRLLVKARFDVPREAGIEELDGGEITLGYVLEKVGGNIDVDPPRDPQPLGELLRGFGIEDPFGLTGRQ